MMLRISLSVAFIPSRPIRPIAVDGAPLGHCAEQPARFGGGIGDGDRFGAAQSDNQLGFQNGKIVLTEEFLHCGVLSMFEGI
ncbi:hypothetical protein H8717_08315 [Oscillospiraceae bacterium BX1]|uniref:Uncharacterized protein n=1 Tax=Yanshouia hominis TaxID=2763673 RepID=A0ABR7NJ18_9FIRM|nr:hypothetical protein [Yanshouia hominis]